ncbi:hypothetical protein EYF80_012810 [Liparis tanakae]|uniref:Uncharacterized protein n=1 Tax=Liparis tanakae TaxID=230148 RepID=A0A4Z2IHM7_9TELE|nr:hypothetical protein EYF80_012810 [Liparis tanakae]
MRPLSTDSYSAKTCAQTGSPVSGMATGFITTPHCPVGFREEASKHGFPALPLNSPAEAVSVSQCLSVSERSELNQTCSPEPAQGRLLLA